MEKDQNTESDNITKKEDNINNNSEDIDQKKPETKISSEEKVKELEDRLARAYASATSFARLTNSACAGHGFSCGLHWAAICA